MRSNCSAGPRFDYMYARPVPAIVRFRPIRNRINVEKHKLEYCTLCLQVHDGHIRGSLACSGQENWVAWVALQPFRGFCSIIVPMSGSGIISSLSLSLSLSLVTGYLILSSRSGGLEPAMVPYNPAFLEHYSK